MTKEFKLNAGYAPAGDQPEAIASLMDGLESGLARQTLLGVTGSGKTFTVANIIQSTQRPTMILAHNKTLAAQLYGEMREFFPHNAVEYFVSYYDYYQPEAYVPSTDTFIEKDASINDTIDKLRLKTTSSILSRRDTIVIASVSCIYNIGDPENYKSMCVSLEDGQARTRSELLEALVAIHYQRNEVDFSRGKFRVRVRWPLSSKVSLKGFPARTRTTTGATPSSRPSRRTRAPEGTLRTVTGSTALFEDRVSGNSRTMRSRVSQASMWRPALRCARMSKRYCSMRVTMGRSSSASLRARSA